MYGPEKLLISCNLLRDIISSIILLVIDRVIIPLFNGGVIYRRPLLHHFVGPQIIVCLGDFWPSSPNLYTMVIILLKQLYQTIGFHKKLWGESIKPARLLLCLRISSYKIYNTLHNCFCCQLVLNGLFQKKKGIKWSFIVKNVSYN